MTSVSDTWVNLGTPQYLRIKNMGPDVLYVVTTTVSEDIVPTPETAYPVYPGTSVYWGDVSLSASHIRGVSDGTCEVRTIAGVEVES